MRNRQIQERIQRLYLLDLETTILSERYLSEETEGLAEAVNLLQPPVCRDIIVRYTQGNTGSNIWVDCTNPMLSLSVSKDFFQRSLNVKLTGNDLFNGGINHIMLYCNRMMYRKMEDNDSRCIQLSLRYRFNVTPSKYKGTGAGNAEKERL